MTSDPADEAERHRQMHDLERFTARQPEQPGPDRPDPIHVLRVRLHDDLPGVTRYALARWSLIARLCRDAERSGDKVTDLGVDALLLCGVGELLWIGIAQGNKWVKWLPPAPVEPVPGSPQERAQRN